MNFKNIIKNIDGNSLIDMIIEKSNEKKNLPLCLFGMFVLKKNNVSIEKGKIMSNIYSTVFKSYTTNTKLDLYEILKKAIIYFIFMNKKIKQNEHINSNELKKDTNEDKLFSKKFNLDTKIKLLFLIFLVIYLFMLMSTVYLWSYLLKQNELASNLAMESLIDYMPYLYQYGFNSNIYYHNNYIKSNKIDIIISNNKTHFDFILNLSIIKKNDNRLPFIFLNKNILFLPVLKNFLSFNNNLLNDDNENFNEEEILKKIKNIDSGIFLINPEDDIINQNNLKDSITFSKKNNQYEFKNLLFPKMKNLWKLTNLLERENKLGNLIDISNIIENFRNRDGTVLNCLSENYGNTFSIIETYNFPKSSDIKEFNNFKNWFLDIWKKKDNIIDSIDKYDFKFYKLTKNELRKSSVIFAIIVLIIFIHLTAHTGGKFLIASLLLNQLLLLKKTYQK